MVLTSQHLVAYSHSTNLLEIFNQSINGNLLKELPDASTSTSSQMIELTFLCTSSASAKFWVGGEKSKVDLIESLNEGVLVGFTVSKDIAS